MVLAHLSPDSGRSPPLGLRRAGAARAALARLWVESLPRRLAPAARRPASTSASAVLLLGGTHGQQRFCDSILAAMGFSAHVAATPVQALQAAGRGDIRCLIVDARDLRLEADFWGRLEATMSRLGPDARPFVYLVGRTLDGHEPSPGQVPRHRRSARPPRVIDLVRAVDGAPWQG